MLCVKNSLHLSNAQHWFRLMLISIISFLLLLLLHNRTACAGDAVLIIYRYVGTEVDICSM